MTRTLNKTNGKTLILHIGMPKTGSTAIQHFMAAHAAELAVEGIDFPRRFTANHGPFLSRCAGAAACERQEKRTYLRTRIKGRSNPEDDRNALREWLKASPHPTLVMSGEAISTFSKSEAERLGALFAEFVSLIRIVVYVREPVASAISMAQQRLKNGSRLKQGKFFIGRAERTYEDFSAVFGPDKVEVRYFNRSAFVQGDIIPDFLSVIGASQLLELFDAGAESSRNESLTHEACLILDQLNAQQPLEIDGNPNCNRSAGIIRDLKQVKGQKFGFDESTLQLAVSESEPIREWLSQIIGEEIRPPEKSIDLSQLWSEETVASLATLLNRMSLESGRWRAARELQDAWIAFFQLRWKRALGKVLNAAKINPDLRQSKGWGLLIRKFEKN